LGVPKSLHFANPLNSLAARGLAVLPATPCLTNCNDSPGNRPFFCSYFGYSGAKLRKKKEKKE